MNNKFELSPFVTPSLTDAVERTLKEAEEQGVDLNELKDGFKVPVKKEFNQDKFEELFKLKEKGTALPGQSLTNSPDVPLPWEQPPEFSSPRVALNSIVKKLLQPESANHLIDAIHQGTSIIDLSSIILYSGFTEGKWSPDTMMLLMEPLMYTLINLAETAEIDYIIDSENNEDEDEVLITKDDISSLDQIKNTILKKGTDFTVLPKEIKEEIKQKVPSILSRT
jgi:hypothetical protein